jgi:membrane fusion protein, multidrug efflux system
MNIPFKLSHKTFLAATIVLAAILSPGCRGKGLQKVAADAPSATVVVAEVTQRTVPIYNEFVGQTRAIETVELRARVEGILMKIYFKEGQPVKKGALLFAIDQRPFEAALQSAKAVLAKAESDLAQARQRTDVLQAQAQLAEAEAVYSKTEQDLARLRPLAREKAVTELELDAATAAEKSAKATVDARKANLTNLEAAVKYTIERAAAEVSAANARLVQVQLDLSYCQIYSPISGVIGFKNIDEGNLVGRGEATLLATVSSSDPLLVDFNLSEIEYLRLTEPGTVGRRTSSLRFELVLSDDSLHQHTGIFKVIDRTVDPQTGTMKIEASFPNPRSYLRPGQFARVRVAIAEHEDAILVPQRAIQELQGAKTVLVVDAQNRVSLRTIRVGDQSENNVIVLDGLNSGEQVIIEGMQKVRPGSEVKITKMPTAEDATQKREGN